MATFTLVTGAKKEAVEIAGTVETAETVGTAGTDKDGEKSKGGKYPESFA